MKYYRDSIIGILRCLIIVVVFLGGTLLLGCRNSPHYPRASKMKAATLQQVVLAAGDAPETKAVIPARVDQVASNAPEMKAVIPSQVDQVASNVPEMTPELPLRKTFQPGDLVEIKFFNMPEFNIAQTVGPDGKITLGLIGEIKAQGKTAAELQDELLGLYAHHMKAPDSPSRIAFQPGDEIEIKFFHTPKLNITQTIGPDGRITLELIGEVIAQGKTAAELRDELMRLYAPHLKAPEIAIVARSFNNRRVFVGGQVMAAGIVDVPGTMTALEAIMHAGGFDMRKAEPRNVIVIRYRKERRYAYKLNLEPALKGKDTEPFYLEPKDIVYVPRTKIAKLGQWVDQHINQIIPDTGLFLRKTHGNTTFGVGTYR